MLLAAVARIVPHVPNFTPVEGLTLFGAAYLQRKTLAAILPILLLYLTDLVINNTVMRPYFTNQEGFVWFSNYMIYSWLSMIFIAVLGSKLLQKVTFKNLVAATLGASILFFVISNFGIWLHATSFYTKDIQGLLTCYTAALPFFSTSLVSTGLFTAILFGGYEAFRTIAAGKTSPKY